MGSGADGAGYASSWVNPNGNVNFPIVNSDGDSNFNWTDNEHDENWRWLVPTATAFILLRLAPGEFFQAESCLFHPPSMRPISSIRSDIVAYFLVSNTFISQESRRNSLSMSSLPVAFWTYGRFCGLLK